jgi:hypothetical protein
MLTAGRFCGLGKVKLGGISPAMWVGSGGAVSGGGAKTAFCALDWRVLRPVLAISYDCRNNGWIVVTRDGTPRPPFSNRHVRTCRC